MTLATELDATVEHLRGVLPPPIFAEIGQSIADLHATGIAGRALGVGDRPVLPSLPDAKGAPVDLAGLVAGGPVVLTFYRGGWCPYCNVTLRALQRVLGAIRAAGAELVGVTPETPEKIEGTAGQAAVEFPILHDHGNAFARSLGLVFELPESLRPRYAQLGIDLPEYNGDATFTLPVPATYVIGHDGVVLWAFVDADFTRRAEPDDILRALG